MSHSGIKKSENACQRNLLKLCTWLDVSRRKYDSRFSNERVSFCVSYERGRCKAKFWRERVREGTIFFHVCVRESHTRASDDCIIPVVNAISRGEFDEFTTRFYEGTKRMDGRFATGRPLAAPPFLIYARRYLCQRIYIPIFIIRNIIARAFIALVEKPRTRPGNSPVSPSFPLPLSFVSRSCSQLAVPLALAFDAISPDAYLLSSSTARLSRESLTLCNQTAGNPFLSSRFRTTFFILNNWWIFDRFSDRKVVNVI